MTTKEREELREIYGMLYGVSYLLETQSAQCVMDAADMIMKLLDEDEERKTED